MNNIKIHGKTYGYQVEGDGPPLVLLHGFTGTSKTWQECKTTWNNYFQTIAIDLPGHGKSQHVVVDSMEEFCHDVNELFTQLHIERAHVLGYSLGGRTALSFAHYYPKRVKSLLLESASPGLKTENERNARIASDEALAKKLETEGIEAFINYWENIPLFESQKKLPEAVQEKIRFERLNQSNVGLAMSLRSMGTGNQTAWWDTLHTLQMPVALITGELDEKFVHINRKMKKLLHDATFHVVSGAGHTVHVEQVEKFVKIVVDFVLENNGEEGALHDS